MTLLAVLIVFGAGITLYDMRFHRIPNIVLVLMLALGVGILIATDNLGWINLAAALAWFFTCLLLYPRVLGAGDVKFAGVLGFFLGEPVYLAAPLVFIVLYGASAVIKDTQRRIPAAWAFGLGAIVAYVAYWPLFGWYRGQF